MNGPRVLWNVRIPLRDGVELANNVYLPPAGVEGGPYPVIFSRNPYNRQVWADLLRWRFFTDHGYAFVTQDCRGRFDSDGEFYPFLDEGPDAYDSIEWIAQQPWCTGKIGMMSGSYGGWVQWAAAREKPPHLTTVVSSCAAGKWGEELPWDRGGMSMVMFTWLYMMIGRQWQPSGHVDWQRVFRHLPLRTMDRAMGKEIPAWQDWLDHPTMDEYWTRGRFDDIFPDLDIPALHLTGLYDGDQPGEMYFWDGMLRSKAAASQHLVLGPWTHGGVFAPTQTNRDIDYRPRSVVDMDELHLQWFDHWLKGIDNGVMDQAPVRYFYAGINEWREEQTWPPADRVSTCLYLHSGGRANTSLGDGSLRPDAPGADEPTDVYRYDPAEIVDLVDVDFFSGVGNFSVRSADARMLELRDDVLAYTSDPFAGGLAISGRPEVVLHVSSDCPDTDFIVGLADVAPSGRVVPLSRDEDHQENVTQGGRLRARFREGLDKEVFMTPGEVYELRIELRDVAHVLKPGHRLRLVVMSWDFPSMARNLNTDESIADGTRIAVATNAVHHTPLAASHVVLPVDPAW
jgi:putative CocE/NonD family hydrolase